MKAVSLKSLRSQRKGFTLIELLIVIAVIAILAAIAIPNLLSSRKSANEASAIGSVRTINSAEATYRSRNGAYTDLPGLATASLVDPALGSATASGSLKSGYYFTIAGSSATQYYVNGQPGTSSSGDRNFYSDESGVIWANGSGTTASADTSGAIPAGTGWSQVGQ